MNRSVFITRNIPGIAVSMLQAADFEVDINNSDRILTENELLSTLRGKNYDAVLSLLTDRINSPVLEAAKTVKIFSTCASGFDNIDIGVAKALNIMVANSPAPLSSLAVAQHTIAFILALATRMVEADDFVRAGKYEGWNPTQFLGQDLSGKVLGIIGIGRIGERVASYAKSLGLKIIYMNAARNEQFEKENNATFYSSLEELLPQADFVTLHVPLLPSTRHMINESNLKLMKKTAFLINTSRGGVVDELALTNALRENIIAGAALDVFEFEPKITPELLGMPNVILTPHIASSNLEARKQMAEIAAQNIIDFFAGKEVKNIVNK